MKNNRKRFAYIVVLIFVMLLIYGFYYEPVYTGSIVNNNNTKIFAHRGFGNYAPDNSLNGAKKAASDGFDGVDVDAQMTKDGKIVIYHDLSLDRLTSGTGKVSSKSLEELESLDLALKYKPLDGYDWNGSNVASFEDFVEEMPTTSIISAELKVTGFAATGIEEEAFKIIERNNAFDRVYFSSFNPFVLYRLKKLDPRIKTVFIFMDTNWNKELLAEIKPEDKVDLPWILRQEIIRKFIRKIIKPDALSVNNEVDEKVVNLLIEKGNPVFLWTIDDKERLEWAKSKDPYAIISDEPYLAKEVINTK